ncbi:hypothetical protein [Actinomadura sp. NEAU-AAG7]|uniref:hypothetical protein n=1 Tax=Actinomadura sp. NEAU-AAG7 TaxID=2839640 RepID=UPI001BE47880|nr:hypothetical protein [Actinomadura sp. NEAU-AAG7]MBT2210170.1 hypothetical protein [Actinomadura sp. NEAU-AAG7]
MKLVMHVQETPILTVLRQERVELQLRHERAEQTISQLTPTIVRLTAELDRVTVERDFLSAATTTPIETPPEPPIPAPIPTPGGVEVALTAGKEKNEDDDYWATIAFGKPQYPWHSETTAQPTFPEARNTL